MSDRQPFLNDQVIVLRSPTQVWSDRTGDAGGAGIAGVYHGDVRVFDELTLVSDGVRPEWISMAAGGASAVTFTGVLRHLDGDGADPRVRIERVREVTSDSLDERIEIRSARDVDVRTRITVGLRPSFAPMDQIKQGSKAVRPRDVQVADGGVRLSAGSATAVVVTDGAIAEASAERIVLEWDVLLAPRATVSLAWRVGFADTSLVVDGAPGTASWSGFEIESDDSRLSRWVTAALSDLDALRMRSVLSPGDEFLAAGAPWFFTLFGRDSLWSARFLLPLSTELALSTLRVLAAVQGTTTDPETAEQPGKIMHEVRAAEIRGSDFTLPPLYYGTIDATPLWICLLHDAWRWGAAEEDIRPLLPALQRALDWMRHHGDSDGDGFLEYIDSSGHGLANQGWKDSGDSIQWRDGTLAEGPIALCEVQAYAYEAAMHGADLLDHFGLPDAAEWREWARRLKERFAESFWVDDPQGGRYPAVALDGSKRRVDTLTSNLGHLLGTGILDPDEEREVAQRLTSPRLDSGFGLRTMGSDAAGFWPLSYHVGSVWAHDTAIAIAGLSRAGLVDHAAGLVEGLLRAAEHFDFRMPELHSGDSASETRAPAPYPASCRPQAWSAAAAVAVLGAQLQLRPTGDGLTARTAAGLGAVRVKGVRVGGTSFSVGARDGRTEISALADPLDREAATR
ncbi:glycogen debranching N-terminal domain-containing protein [Leifsonia sp. L25]|uniref:glycogen debranching N-terminal domain-containing protein n=1 Tax=Actinomycetes TaxID=1760 RepID=UPI003D692AA9